MSFSSALHAEQQCKVYLSYQSIFSEFNPKHFFVHSITMNTSSNVISVNTSQTQEMSRNSDHTGTLLSPGDLSFLSLLSAVCMWCCDEQQWMCRWTEIRGDLQAQVGLGEEEEEEEGVILWTSEERNGWKRKRIMLHNQAVYFPAWNGEHKKRCLDAFIVGASFGWLCHCLLPKTKFLKCIKNAYFSYQFSSELPRFSFINTDATNNLQNIQHTVTSIYNGLFTTAPWPF